MDSKIYITDHNHSVYSGARQDSSEVPPSQRPLTEGEAVTIEGNVWISKFVTVLPGVIIGYGIVSLALTRLSRMTYCLAASLLVARYK